jgi:hypothetical protein
VPAALPVEHRGRGHADGNGHLQLRFATLLPKITNRVRRVLQPMISCISILAQNTLLFEWLNDSRFELNVASRVSGDCLTGYGADGGGAVNDLPHGGEVRR